MQYIDVPHRGSLPTLFTQLIHMATKVSWS